MLNWNLKTKNAVVQLSKQVLQKLKIRLTKCLACSILQCKWCCWCLCIHHICRVLPTCEATKMFIFRLRNDQKQVCRNLWIFIDLWISVVCRFFFAVLKLWLAFHINPALPALVSRVASMTAVVSVMLWIWSHLCLISVFFR